MLFLSEKSPFDQSHDSSSGKIPLKKFAKPWIVKFTNQPGVDQFITILCAAFALESALRRFSLFMIWLRDFLAPKYWQKMCT